MKDVLAADLVAVVAEDHPADRPGDEAHRERRECQERADQRIEVGKEQLVEDQRGGDAVDEEVVPLQRGPDQTRDDDATHRRGRCGGGRWARGGHRASFGKRRDGVRSRICAHATRAATTATRARRCPACWESCHPWCSGTHQLKCGMLDRLLVDDDVASGAAQWGKAVLTCHPPEGAGEASVDQGGEDPLGDTT